LHHRWTVALATLTVVAAAFLAPASRADEASRRLAEAREAVKESFRDRDSEGALKHWVPAAVIARLEAADFFTGPKGDEIRRESLLLARKLAFEKRPDVSPPSSLAAALTSGGETEPNDSFETANPIECDGTILAAISPAGDMDWFSFTIGAQRLVDLTIDCGGDSTMTLFSAVGVPIEFDDDDGPGLCSKIARVLAPGTYAVSIHEFGDDGTLPYTLEITCTAPPEPEVEPNGTLASAQVLGCARAVNATISPAGDVDIFRVTLDSTYRIIAAVDCTGDSTLALRDAAGALVEFDDDDGIGFCSRIERTLAAGTYHLEAREFGDNGTLTYRLRIVCLPLGGDETEPNDSLGTADPTACGAAAEGHVEPIGDADFWSIDLAEPADLEIEVGCSGASAFLAVFDSGGGLVANAAGSAGACPRVDVHLDAGTWFVLVRETANAASFDYSLSVECLPPVDETEPNDTRGSADPVACGASTTARLHPAGDLDLFALSLDAQYDVAIDVACDGDARLRLLDAFGAELAFDDDSGPSLCPRIATRLDPADYFLEVSSSDPSAKIDYSLAISCVTPFPPESEPNDDVASADPLVCDEVLQGTILPIGDVDFFRLDLAERRVVTADVDCLSRDATLALRDASGALIEFDDDDGIGLCPTITRLLEAGTYHLEVREGGGDSVMPYRIRALCVALPTVDETEPNGDIASADSLPCGAPMRGVVESAGDADYWLFTLAAPTAVRLRVTPEMPALDPAVKLFDAATGRLLRVADDAGGPEARIVMTLAAGAYAAEVRALAGADPFAVYAIEASCAPPSLVSAGCLDDGHARDGALPAAGDVAEWLYDGRAGEIVRVIARSSTIDPHLSLLGPGGALVDLDDDDAEGLDAQIETALPADGTYRVLVQSAVEGATGLCRAALDVIAPPTSGEIEPNDAPATAQPLPNGSQVTGARSSASDDDFYSFFAAPDDVVSIALRTTLGTDNVPLAPTDLAIELLASDLVPIAISDDDGEDVDPTLLVNLPPSPGGLYLVRVAGLTAGAYELFFRFDQFPVTVVPAVGPKLRSGDPVSIRISGKNVSPVDKFLTFTVDRVVEGGNSTRVRTRSARAPVGIMKTVTMAVGVAPTVASPTRVRYVSTVTVGATSVTSDFDVVVEP